MYIVVISHLLGSQTVRLLLEFKLLTVGMKISPKKI